MIRACRECGDQDDDAYDELCDFCAEVFNSVCNHMVKDLCASCDADLASADSFPRTLAPNPNTEETR